MYCAAFPLFVFHIPVTSLKNQLLSVPSFHSPSSMTPFSPCVIMASPAHTVQLPSPTARLSRGEGSLHSTGFPGEEEGWEGGRELLMAKGRWTSTPVSRRSSRIRKAETDEGFGFHSEAQHRSLWKEYNIIKKSSPWIHATNCVKIVVCRGATPKKP